MNRILLILIIFFINIFSMEPNEQTKLLNDTVINIQEPGIHPINDDTQAKFKDIKTDFEFINLLPAEIWHHIIECLDIKDKKTIKSVLHFFAPRIGLPKKWAKIVAVDLSNFATLKSNNLNEWEDRIKNPFKSWGKLKKYRKFSNQSKNSKELIEKYLKIINKSFLEKIKLFNQALTSNNQKQEFEKNWEIIESEIAQIAGMQHISFPEHVYAWPDFSKCPAKKLKEAYLELQKISLLGKTKIIYNLGIIATSIVIIVISLIAFLYSFALDGFYSGLIGIGIVWGIFILFTTIFCIFTHICKCRDDLFEEIKLSIRSIVALLCKKVRTEFKIKLSDNLICSEINIKKLIKNSNRIEEYQDSILEFLNSKLRESEEDKNLDKILIETLNDHKAAANLKEEL